ncbi:MAG: hypothetical protein QOF78_181 [Phycisphaerales bacterium]|nr:hypothetical protein [Phycisphaerales bacterium]
MLPHTPEPANENDEESTPVPGKSRVWQVVVAIVAGVVGLGYFMYRPGPALALADEAAAWSKGWNDSVRRSRDTGKPALVLYTADWCPACRWFESEVLIAPEVKTQMTARYTPIMVDMSRRDSPNHALAKQYKIEALPTLVLYNREGRELARTHALPVEDLVAWLRSDGGTTK